MNAYTDFERLELASDANVVAALLAEGLERVWQVAIDIVAVAVPRAFPRREGGFTLDYRATIKRVGAATEESLQLGGHLLGSDEAWPRYARTETEHVIIDEDLRLVVPLFPFDPALPALQELLHPERALALVHDALPWQADGFNVHIGIDVLRYRLERRCVVRFRDGRRKGERRTDTCVAKVIRPTRVTALRHTLRLLGRSPLVDFLPRTWGVDENRGIHWMESVPAPSLHELLEAPAFVEGCQETARALRALHRLRPEGLPRYTVPEAVHDLRESLAFVTHIFPERAADYTRAQALLEARRPAVPTTLSCIHRNFYDKEVLHAAHRTTVLDWDTLAAGDPAQDHGNFTAHLFLRRQQVAPRHDAFLQGGAQTFRACYGATSVDFEQRSRWWHTAALLRLAALYAFRRRWRHLTEPLLERACRFSAAPLHVVLPALLLTLALPHVVRAERPDYMRLAPRLGQPVAIVGTVGADGAFVARSIESLPNPCSPVIRAALEAVDPQEGWFQLLGVCIQVPANTVFEGPDSLRVPLEELRPGDRVEVRCHATARGDWVARRLRTFGVKASNQIKGIITRVAVDGTPPDTLEIAGLAVLLDERTGLWGGIQRDALEAVRFGALPPCGAVGSSDGKDTGAPQGAGQREARPRNRWKGNSDGGWTQKWWGPACGMSCSPNGSAAFLRPIAASGPRHLNREGKS